MRQLNLNSKLTLQINHLKSRNKYFRVSAKKKLCIELFLNVKIQMRYIKNVKKKKKKKLTQYQLPPVVPRSVNNINRISQERITIETNNRKTHRSHLGGQRMTTECDNEPAEPIFTVFFLALCCFRLICEPSR